MGGGVKTPLFVFAGIGIFLLAAWLRLAGLSTAPLHFDEAVQARIAASHLDAPMPRSNGQAGDAETVFNPRHFHGPLPGYAAAATARLAGEKTWQALTKGALRIVPAVSGLAVVLLLLGSAPLIGRIAALWAAAFAAVSPFLVHYNRLFIHENLLALFLMAALFLLGLSSKYRVPVWTVGIFLGLAAATKETFVLAPVSWAIAAMVVYPSPASWFRSHLPQLLAAGAAFLAVIFVFYSGFGARPAGMLDFFSTYWSYQLGEGHEKSSGYYAGLFLLPSHYGRLWWWQGGMILLAAVSLFQKPDATPVPAAARFCFLAGLLQAGAYSLLPYKTPWLMTVPWLHFLLAAGMGSAALASCEAFGKCRPLLRAAAAALLVGLLAFQGLQAWRVAFRYPSDTRNPFAYVPTAPGIESWTARSVRWLKSGDWIKDTVSVIGPAYWPLPWYLRDVPHVGYWPGPPDGISGHAMVIAMPGFAPLLSVELAKTHVAVPEGLRSDTPVLVFVRKDIWEARCGDAR